MKLLYILNQRYPAEKAYSLQVTKMCEAFGREIETTLITPKRGTIPIDQAFERYNVKKTFSIYQCWAPDWYWPGKLDRVAFHLKNFLSSLSIAWYAFTSKSDIMYSREELPLFFVSMFSRNVVFEAHKISSKRSILYRWFRFRKIKIISVTELLRQRFIKWGYPEELTSVASDGVDLEDFVVPSAKKELQEKYNIGDRKIIGYVGMLRTAHMKKGVNELLEAFHSLLQKEYNVHLLIVGGAPYDVEHYQKTAYALGIPKDKISFTGYVNNGEVPKYLKACDVLTMPYPPTEHFSYFMSSLKLFEYMASGVPIVTSDLPSIRETVDEQSATFIEPDNAVDLERGIKECLDNPDEATKRAKRAHELVGQYTWNKRAKNILAFIS